MTASSQLIIVLFMSPISFFGSLRYCRLRLFAVTVNPEDDISRLESEVSLFLR